MWAFQGMYQAKNNRLVLLSMLMSVPMRVCDVCARQPHHLCCCLIVLSLFPDCLLCICMSYHTLQ